MHKLAAGRKIRYREATNEGGEGKRRASERRGHGERERAIGWANEVVDGKYERGGGSGVKRESEERVHFIAGASL